MEYSKLKEQAISLEEAVKNIDLNTGNKYNWYAVKNSKKSYFELGGTSKELKAYIPKIENNKIIVHPNGFIKFEYAIYSNLDWLEFSNFRVELPVKEWNKEKMLEFLNKTDFKTYYPKIHSYERVKEYETIYSLESL